MTLVDSHCHLDRLELSKYPGGLDGALDRTRHPVPPLDRDHACPVSQLIQAEVIDPRTLRPLDLDTILASVRKTNRVVVAYEDTLSWGYGAEIAARMVVNHIQDDRDPMHMA